MKPLRLLLLFLSLCPLAVYAQTAEVGGAVQDPSGAVIPKASVEFRNQDTGVRRQTTTNGSGVYHIVGVDPGKYDATVQANGFKTLTRENITLQVGDKSQIDFKMQLGQAAENVSVDGSGLQMNTVDGSVGTVIDQKFVANLPLNGRSFQDLIDLTPGVVTQSPQSGGNTGSNGDFSVNGQRTQSNNYLIDGVSANNLAGNGGGGLGPGTSGSLGASTALGTTQSLISVDALQEFRIESATYSAEYGRSPGGQFAFVTKSGTSSFHGTVFDYLRNNFFDSNDWFNDHNGIRQPALRQNDFGGTVGGPLGFFGRRKAEAKSFFFFSYEGLRLDQPTEASLQYVPSTSLRESAPSALQPILNAYSKPTGQEIQIACNNSTFQCPSGQPVGTLVASGLAPFTAAFSLPSKIDSTSLRLDHTFGTRTHVFLRAGYTPSSSDARPYPGVFSSDISNQQTYTGGFDTQFSSSLNDEFRVGYAHSVVKVLEVLDDFGGAMPTNLSEAIGNNASRSASNSYVLTFNGIGNADLFTQNDANYGLQWNIADSLNWTTGRHSVKVGVDYRRITSPYQAFDPYLSATYQSPISVLTNSAAYVLIERNLSERPVYNQFALFAEDQWRLVPSLTLSYGVRWEVNPAPHSANSVKPYPLLGNTDDPSTYSLGTPGAQLYNTTWGNFAPRIGVAWQVNNHRSTATVVRAGFGVFYDTGTAGTGQALASIGTSTYIEPTHVALPILPAQLDLPFTVTPPYANTVYAIAPNLSLPLTLQWSAAVEQALGERQNLTLSYVAASGQRLIKENEISGGTLNHDFKTILLYQNGLSSNYQALQAQFQRQVGHGLQAIASYTWAHSIDYGSEDANIGYVRGNSDYDVRNSLNAALTWDIPWRSSNAFGNEILGGWGLDGRIIARTAFPVTLQGSAFFDPVTGVVQYAGLDLIPNVPVYVYSSQLPGGRKINTNAFGPPATNVLGNAPRNFARGFGENQLNIAARRQFAIGERFRLQFRAETFNILNHPNFGHVDPTRSDATFGQATSTLAQSLGTVSPLYQQGGARSMQFALKLQF